MSRLQEGLLRTALSNCRWIRRLVVLDEVDSTNDEARRLAAAGQGAGTVVIAERQTAGRGRRGRRWHSSPGVGLYVSAHVPAVATAADAPRWTLAAAVAACEACRRAGVSGVVIQWPNDLESDGRKVGGILAEMRSVAGASELIIGTGINVHHERGDFAPEIRDTATSLRLASGGREPTREALAARYLEALGGMADALNDGAWPAVARAWEELAPDAAGRRVRVLDAHGATCDRGVTAGLAGDGALRVRSDDGSTILVRLADSVVAEEE